MAIIAINVNTTGLVGNNIEPRRCTMITTDTLQTVTTAGYLNNQNIFGNPILPTDVFDVLYDFDENTRHGIFGIFQVDYNINTGFTLNAWENPGNVIGPVVVGNFATFSNVSGQIEDAGYSPTDPAKTKVVMLDATPVVAGHVAVYSATNGTIADGGVLGTASAKAASDNAQPTVASVNGATTANAVAVFADIAGTVKNASTTTTLGQNLQITGSLLTSSSITSTAGNITSGSSGDAGTFVSFPSTAANGSMIMAAVNAGGAFDTTISNRIMGQSTVYSIPDVEDTVGTFLVGAGATPIVLGEFPVAGNTNTGLMVSSGIQVSNIQPYDAIHADSTADIGGGGAGPISVVVPDLTASSKIVATIASSSNTVAVAKCIATATGFDITFTADPGAACVVNYIAFIVAQ